VERDVRGGSARAMHADVEMQNRSGGSDCDRAR
jgi:hypothetical protein